MSKNFVAKATTSISAARAAVWEALITPASIKNYMFGADVESDWRAGSPITWKGEMRGMKYEDKGVILKIDKEQTLQYTHFSPLSGLADESENYHVVTINLSGSGDTTKVSLSQDKHADQKSCKESQRNWDVMLNGLKGWVETKSSDGAAHPMAGAIDPFLPAGTNDRSPAMS